MTKRRVLIALVFVLLILAAIIVVFVVACNSSPVPAAVNTCVSCHTDETLIKELTASIEPHKKSALIQGEC
jgi:nitrate/TMAO reductase-like tetraheme cytochrome c subunit